uniref:Uncharacterized protein n=1 Tax=Phthorimaea operculella granulovirus TaxID=192584 RepID=A0A1B2CRZ5_9BBAC|nr:hypothetical protein PhopGVgp030 [Phthorimaea operculella granulovirus]QBH65865.1 hypothetical protein PhopGVgp030 [Phthorimaea operculella granulovirus]QBH65995.1 hypothetical protein PhopGVgp030 [Phthorimaea operculella granulovirus]QBH66125.1 hypothetical protein PhopGVgp030 [Phthorimaea operculella granulovirus]QBH66255.1 hypothetical protein PhopGVgp030 [Phthorimaea operculella granulovirus]
MEKFYLIHETSFRSLDNILTSGAIFTSGKTQHMTDYKGQGSKNRRLAKNPRVSLDMPNFGDVYDEVDGVYFRLHPKTSSVRNKFSECVLIFSSSLLRQFNFCINTEENFGFMIDEDGLVNESQFSGEPGMSITSLENIDLIESEAQEVVVTSDVPIIYLRHVLFNKDPPIVLSKKLHQMKIVQFNIS